MDTMVKAAVLVEPWKMEIREFPMPKPERGAAICKSIMSGVCGTDKHTYRGESTFYKGTKNEIRIPYPIIQGHENVMEIVEIDEEGSKNLEFDGNILKVGDRVTMCPDVVCQHCWYCRNMPTFPICEHMIMGYGHMRSCNDGKHLYGGFSEYVYIEPGTRLYKIPDGLPDRVAVLTEPMCVTWTLDRASAMAQWPVEGFNFNDTVLVQGVGPLGLSHVIKARMMGAGKIIVTDIDEYRLNLAKEFGADVTINSSKTTEDERVDLVCQETGGRGVDVAVECVGRPFVFPEGIRMLRKSGTYLEPGNYVDCGTVPINIHEICSKNLRIMGFSNHAHNAYKPMMEMMLRNLSKFPWEKFVSHEFKLDDADLAVRTSMSPGSMKVVIEPNKK